MDNPQVKKEDCKEFEDTHLVFDRETCPISLTNMRKFIDEVFIQKFIMELEVGESFDTDFRRITRTK
jgi:hypothetical protein